MHNNRTVHLDLLDQVADSAAERDAVRRILSEPLTEADLDAQQRWKAAPWPFAPANHAHRFSACVSGPCEQGRKLCPSPEACLRADRAELGEDWRSARAARVLTGIVLIAVGAMMGCAVWSAASALVGALQ